MPIFRVKSIKWEPVKLPVGLGKGVCPKYKKFQNSDFFNLVKIEHIYKIL